MGLPDTGEGEEMNLGAGEKSEDKEREQEVQDGREVKYHEAQCKC